VAAAAGGGGVLHPPTGSHAVLLQLLLRPSESLSPVSVLQVMAALQAAVKQAAEMNAGVSSGQLLREKFMCMATDLL
jgi:hypothetical protein